MLVPVVRNAESLDFRAFVMAYEDLVRKVHTQKVTADDFVGATVTLTNPGTLGTVQSVPRLMPGQGAIIGVGSLGFPAEYQAADRRSLAALGVGPVVTLTSTYDHRIIQGAESGLFLTHMAECLTGGHGFFETVFAAMDVPYEPVRWQADVNAVDSEHQRLVKQVRVQSLVNMYRVRGHLIADLDPLSAEPRHLHAELDPTTYGLTLWDLDREFVVDGLAGRDTLRLAEALDILRDAYCRTLGHRVHAHPGPRTEAVDPASRRGRPGHVVTAGAAPHPRPAERGRGLRAIPAHPLRRAEAIRSRRGRVDHRPPRHPARRGRHRRASPRPCSAWPTGVG